MKNTLQISNSVQNSWPGKSRFVTTNTKLYYVTIGDVQKKFQTKESILRFSN